MCRRSLFAFPTRVTAYLATDDLGTVCFGWRNISSGSGGGCNLIENQEDILVKTLERYIKALGGELEVRAKFPDRVVMLSQFTSRTPGEEIRPN